MKKLKWRSTLHISGEKEHQSHYYNDEYGIAMGIFTEKINDFDFGKAKRYFKVDGNKRTFTTWKVAWKVASDKKRMAQRKFRQAANTATLTQRSTP